MKIITKDIFYGSEKLALTNQRVLYWKKEDILILSDLHIGKAAHFRINGIPISAKVLDDDLERLKSLIEYFNPETLLVVGDLFHAEMNKELQIFHSWLAQFKTLNKVLVKGNHDRISKSIANMFYDWKVENELVLNKIKFIHEPKVDEANYSQISGHIHPGVFIKGKGKQRFKLPCFQVYEKQLILPAFSLFTGLNTRVPKDKLINYAFTSESIFEL